MPPSNREDFTLSKTDWTQTWKNLNSWHFGGKGSGLEDPLAALVVQGLKTGTSGWYEAYLADNEPLPQVGEFSCILNSQDKPVCVIELLKVEVIPFLEVGAEFARSEGEGDRSLAYWRDAHSHFFQSFEDEIGLKWDPQKHSVVCETFRVCHVF